MMALAKSLVAAARSFSAASFSFPSFSFLLIFLPRVELSLRDLAHLLAFGFPLLAVDVGKILDLNITLAQEINMALPYDALRLDLGLVADPHELCGLLLCVPVMPAEVRAFLLVFRRE
jgi:hypothetical protein